MINNRYQLFEKSSHNSFESRIPDMLNMDFVNRLTGSDVLTYTIPLKYNYRPDLIAKEFYGDGKLFWVLVYFNNIGNSPEGFYSGATIKIPNVNKVRSM